MDKFPTAYYPNQQPTPHRSSSRICSCIAAIAFIVAVVVTLTIVFFLLFRPQTPTVEITAVKFPDFSALNNSLAFTFAQRSTVRNPNRQPFSHYDSTIDLIYRNGQVGFMYIPAGEIGGGRTQYMEASFRVGDVPVAAAASEMEVETRMRMKGRVRVLRFFMHRVEATARCRVAVAAGTGAVLGIRC